MLHNIQQELKKFLWWGLSVIVFLALIGSAVNNWQLAQNSKSLKKSAGGITATVFDAQNNPEAFYLSADGSPNMVTGEIIEIAGKKFTPYRMSESKDSYRVEWKSAKGTQSVVISKKKPNAELYEDIGFGWELLAVAEPKFQYSTQGWQNYQLDFSDATVENEVNETFSRINIGFTVIDSTGRSIPASLSVAIGFDGTKYINSWEFYLSDNPNNNRLVWDIEHDREKLAEYKNNQTQSYFASVLGGASRLAINRSAGSEVKISVADFIKQNNGNEKLISQQEGEYYFYPNGQIGEMLVDPVLTSVTADTNITISTGSGTTGDFKLFFSQSSGGLDQGFLGSAGWGGDLLVNPTNSVLLTELNQDASAQTSTASTLRLLEASSTRAVVRNSFTLGSEASVVEDYYIYSSGKIVKKIVYTKLDTGTEVRYVAGGATNFVIAGGSGYGNDGGTPPADRPIGTYYDTQIIRLDVRSASSDEITDYQNPDMDLGILKGASLEEDATTTAGFNTWDGSYGVDLTATDTAVYISDLDGGTQTRYDPVFKIRGWSSISTPNYVALNGTTLASGTNYNASLKPISSAYYATDAATTTLSAGGDYASSTEFLASSLNNKTMDFASGENLYLGFEMPVSGVNINLATAGVGGTVTWQYCSAVTSGNCSTWSALTVNSTVNGINNFTALSGSVYFDTPSNWATSTADSITYGPSVYYLRIVGNGSYAPSPVESTIWSDVLVFQYLGNITTNNNSFVIARASKMSAGSGDINTAGTWSPSGVPSATDNILIQNTHSVTFVNSPATVNIKNLFIASGGSFVMGVTTTDATTTLDGSLIASGNFEMRANSPGSNNYNIYEGFSTLRLKSASAGENGVIVESSGTMSLRGPTSIDIHEGRAGDQRGIKITRFGSNNGFIYLKDGAEAIIQNSEIAYMGANASRKYGIYADAIDNGTANEGLVVTGSIIDNGYDGIYLSGSTDVIVSDNRIFANSNNGITVATTSNSTFYANTVWFNGATGYSFINGDSNIISNNTLDANVTSVLFDTDSSSNTIKNSIIILNTTGLTNNGTSNTIDYNLFNSNTSDGSVGTNSLSSAVSVVDWNGIDNIFGNSDDDLTLAAGSVGLGDGDATNVNIGSSLGYVVNVIDNIEYGYHGGASGAAGLSAGDTITTYTVDSATSTISTMQDNGEVLQITANDNIITANNQYVGNYAYFNNGNNRGLYYLITDSVDNGLSGDSLTINASSTIGFTGTDNFTIIDRYYSKRDLDLITLVSNYTYNILDLSGSGTLGNPITWNTKGTVVLDNQGVYGVGIYGNEDAYIVIDGFKIMRSAEDVVDLSGGGNSFGSGIMCVYGCNGWVIKNTDTYLNGGGAYAVWGSAPGIYIFNSAGVVNGIDNGTVIQNVNSFSNSAYGANFSGYSTTYLDTGLTIKKSNFFLNQVDGIFMQNHTDFLIADSKFYLNKGDTSNNGGMDIITPQNGSIIGNQFFANTNNGLNLRATISVNEPLIISNNIFYANGGEGLRVFNKIEDAKIYNNVFDGNWSSGLRFTAGGANKAVRTIVKNNIFSNNLYGIFEEYTATGGNTFNYNYFYKNTTQKSYAVSTSTDANSFNASATPGVNLEYLIEDSGTASSGSTSSLQDATKNWVKDQWAGSALKIASVGGGATTTAIIANSTSTLTLSPVLSTAISTNAYTITNYFITPTSTATTITPLGKGVDTTSGIKSSAVNMGARTGLVQNTTDSINSNTLQSANDASGLDSGDNVDIIAVNIATTTIASASNYAGGVSRIAIGVPDGVIVSNDQFNGMYLYVDQANATYTRRYFPIINSSSTDDILLIAREWQTSVSTTAVDFGVGDTIKIVDRIYKDRNYVAGNGNGVAGRTANVRLTKDGTFASPIVWSASSTGAVIIDAGYDYYASSTNSIYGDGAQYNQFIGATTDLLVRGSSAYNIGVSSTAITALEFRNTILNSTSTNEVEPITLAGSYVYSVLHDQDAGEHRLWGEYASAGGGSTSFSKTYAAESYTGSGDTNTIKNLYFMQDGDRIDFEWVDSWYGQNTSNRSVMKMGYGIIGNFSVTCAVTCSFANTNFNGLDDNGIQFSGSNGNDSLSNNDFSSVGTASVSSTAMTITTSNFSTNKTFIGVTFTGFEAGDNYASTTGGSSSYYWYFDSVSGEDKDGSDADPGMLIWQDSAPTAPTIGTATSTVSTNLTVNFTDNAINETGFSLVNTSGATATTSVQANLSSETSTGLASNTQYTYYAVVYNTSASPTKFATSSSSVSAYTLAPTPTNFATTSVDNTTATLSVDVINNQTSGSSGYFFNRSTGENSGWIQTNTWIDTGLTADTSYNYTVAYRNGDGYVTASTTLLNVVTTASANTPNAPTISNIGSESMIVIINKNSNPGTDTYEIFETGSNKYVQSNGTLGSAAVWQGYIDWGGASGVSVSGLSVGTSYTFQVKAKTSGGSESSFSASASGSTTGGGHTPVVPNEQQTPTVAPNTPSIQLPQAVGSTKIRWYFEDNAINESGFRLKDGEGNVLAEKKTPNLTYIEETGLKPNTRYSGRQIVAYNDIGESNLSGDLAPIYTLANIPGKVKIETIDSESIKVVIDVNNNPSYTQFLIKDNNTLKYLNKIGTFDSWSIWQTEEKWDGPKGIIVKGLADNQEYEFVVKAKNEDQVETTLSESYKFTINDTIAPAKPTINYPIDGAIIRSSQFPVTGLAEPSSSINIVLDGKDLGYVVSVNESGQFSFDLPNALSEATHTLIAKAKDEAGNVSSEALIKFTVQLKRPDGQEPSVTIGNSTWRVEPNTIYAGEASNIYITVRDKDEVPMAGHLIKILSSDLNNDKISGIVSGIFREVTDVNGVAQFEITSNVAHKLFLSVFDETDGVLLINNLSMEIKPLDATFIVIGSNKFILKANSIFTFEDNAEIKIHLEDKFRNVVREERNIKLYITPNLGAINRSSIITKDGYATVNYSSPGANSLPSEINRITINASTANLNGQLTIVVVRAPTPKETQDKKIQEAERDRQLAEYYKKVEEAKATGQPIPPAPILPKKITPLPLGLSAASAAGSINLEPDDKGRITVVVGQSFEISYKPTGRPVEISLYALTNEYKLADENGDGTYSVTLSFGKEEKGKEITMLILERFANGEVKVTPITALIDPYGYVYTKVNNDSKHPLVLNSEQRIENARVLLYWQDTKTNEWVKWPAQNYYQENPLFTNKQGEYSFMVPEGNYYLTVYRDGYQFYRSSKVTVENAKPVNVNMFIASKYEVTQTLQNLLNLIGISTNLPDYIIYLFLALAAILGLGSPLIIWMSVRVYRDRKKLI